jgi:tetratricopeptide (TPR) repeat protein
MIRPWLAVTFWLAIALPGLAGLLEEARQAHRDGVPEVAIAKLTRLLTDRPAPDAVQLLAECYLETGRTDEAYSLIKQHPDFPNSLSLQATAALQSGKWQEAIGLYHRLISDPAFAGEQGPMRLNLAQAQRALGRESEALGTLQPLLSGAQSEPKAKLFAAEMLLAQGQVADARRLVSQIPDHEEPLTRLCLEGELRLAENDLPGAETAFSRVLSTTQGQTKRTLAVAQLGAIKVAIRTGALEDAENQLERLIDEEPESFLLPELYALLDQVYSSETNPSPNELVRWSNDTSTESRANRAAYALYYLAKLWFRQGEMESGRETCERLYTSFPDHALQSKAILLLAREFLKTEQPAKAIEVLERLSREPDQVDTAEITPVLAEAYYRNGDYQPARKLFEHLATHDGIDSAWFNAAICSLRLGDEVGFNSAMRAFRADEPDSTRVGELLFAKGLLEARTGQSAANETLEKFLKSYSHHPAAARARLMLAEVRATEQPPNLAGAQRELLQVSGSDPDILEKRDRLSFFIAASDPKSDFRNVLGLAQSYLKQYPNAPGRAEVRLKLGELYYRQNDFPNAQTQFELVREETPDSPLEETALFLAGEAARKSLNPQSVDRAIALFEEVYKLGGPLRFQARLEQALSKRQIEQETEAIVLLEDLVAQDPPAEVRYEAIDNKGQAQFALAAADPKLYEQAATTFESLAAAPGVPAQWRQRALYKKGKSLEKLGHIDEALAAYYDALAVEDGTGDQLWFYRSGFDAALILESRSAWQSAAAIYEKLAATRGARASEAKERLTRLRLEHFLWPE